MIELDDALREHAAQWRRDEPAPPDLDSALATARVRRSRRPVLLAVSAAACVLVIAIAAILLDFRTGSHPVTGGRPTFESRPLGHRSVTSLGRVPPTTYPEAIREKASDSAHANGDDHATAQAVRTTFVKAEQASDAGTDNGPDHAVWLVQLEGTFVCAGCKYPAGAKAPSGRFITLIIDDESPYATSVFGISNRQVDLGRLGTVVTLLP